jgi:hypothetical protein
MRSCATRQGVDRLLLKMPVRLGPMAKETPKAPISGGKAVPRLRDQRVEDNAFHRVAIKFIGPDNPFYSESDIRFRQRDERAARPLWLQSPGFASRTRRGISPSLDSPAT